MLSQTQLQVVLYAIIAILVGYVLYKVFVCKNSVAKSTVPSVKVPPPMAGGDIEIESHSDEIVEDNIYGGV